jgi:dATP pyrophosphohydrolase
MTVAVQRRFKRPESVLVVVYTVAAEVLILRRRRPPDFWQSVTGSLAWDEQPAAAAQRELMEETALSGSALVACGIVNRFPIMPPWRDRYEPGVRENIEHVFRLELPARLPVRLSPQEHQSYVWLPRDDAAERVSSYTNHDAILELVPISR